MSDYNTFNEMCNIETEESKDKKKVGFNKFAYYNLNKEGYSMNITAYETAVRKAIFDLKEEKKTASGDRKKEIEKAIAKKKSELINNTDNAVFNYLMAHVQYNNKVNLNKIRKTQSGIAEELFLNRQTVSSSFTKLKRLNIISYKREGNAFTEIEISPYICWQGEATSHSHKIAIMRESFKRKPFEMA